MFTSTCSVKAPSGDASDLEFVALEHRVLASHFLMIYELFSLGLISLQILSICMHSSCIQISPPPDRSVNVITSYTCWHVNECTCAFLGITPSTLHSVSTNSSDCSPQFGIVATLFLTRQLVNNLKVAFSRVMTSIVPVSTYQILSFRSWNHGRHMFRFNHIPNFSSVLMFSWTLLCVLVRGFYFVLFLWIFISTL